MAKEEHDRPKEIRVDELVGSDEKVGGERFHGSIRVSVTDHYKASRAGRQGSEWKVVSPFAPGVRKNRI
jgi:hypothetical protein